MRRARLSCPFYRVPSRVPNNDSPLRRRARRPGCSGTGRSLQFSMTFGRGLVENSNFRAAFLHFFSIPCFVRPGRRWLRHVLGKGGDVFWRCSLYLLLQKPSLANSTLSSQ